LITIDQSEKGGLYSKAISSKSTKFNLFKWDHFISSF